MSQIKQLDKTSVNRICSGQVIVDLKTSVKELIENALVCFVNNVIIIL